MEFTDVTPKSTTDVPGVTPRYPKLEIVKIHCTIQDSKYAQYLQYGSNIELFADQKEKDDKILLICTQLIAFETINMPDLKLERINAIIDKHIENSDNREVRFELCEIRKEIENETGLFNCIHLNYSVKKEKPADKRYCEYFGQYACIEGCFIGKDTNSDKKCDSFNNPLVHNSKDFKTFGDIIKKDTRF